MSRAEAVDALAGDPWYQLSTAGQELFHTNMLYWLAVHRPTQSREVWEFLGINPSDGYGGQGPVRREWRHVDLYVDPGMGSRKLVLENKLLAIATPGQLMRYHDDLVSRSDVHPTVTNWRLLSLMPPTFAMPEPWTSVDYSELLPALRATAEAVEAPDDVMMRGYVGLVTKLVDLRDAFDPWRDLGGGVFMDAHDRELLDEAKLLSLVLKMQMTRCAEILTARMADLGMGPAGAGLTNAQGLLDWFAPGPSGRQFGWQVQGRQFRFVEITGPKDPRPRVAREALMTGEHADYFSDVLPPPSMAPLLTPYAGKKIWLGYEPNFVYQYQLLTPDLTWSHLLDLAEWAGRRAHRYVKSSAALSEEVRA